MKQVCSARREVGRKRFTNVMWYEDNGLDVSQIARQSVRENHDVVREKCIQMDDGSYTASNSVLKEA